VARSGHSESRAFFSSRRAGTAPLRTDNETSEERQPRERERERERDKIKPCHVGAMLSARKRVISCAKAGESNRGSPEGDPVNSPLDLRARAYSRSTEATFASRSERHGRTSRFVAANVTFACYIRREIRCESPSAPHGDSHRDLIARNRARIRSFDVFLPRS